MLNRVYIKSLVLLFEPIVLVFFIIAGLVARAVSKKIDVGLGPQPLINNVYHKRVFQSLGYSAETFVDQVWHITSDFDIRSDKNFLPKIPVIGYRLNQLGLALYVMFRYRMLVIYFNGGPLGIADTTILWRFEPFILKLANVKTFVLAYGADVQDMTRCPNLLFKHARCVDYPNHKFSRRRIVDKIDLWSTHGDHVFGGCEWVDYMHHWDTLMISHFSIDEDAWQVVADSVASHSDDCLKILHAPNHRTIKGTEHVINAVSELKGEGLNIELFLAEKLNNSEIRRLINSVDLVVDQLIIGWYAMFSIEAMALGRPVVCYHRKDLEALYRANGLLGKDEVFPLIQAEVHTIKDVIRGLYFNRDQLRVIGRYGREYVVKHHSISAIAKHFGPVAKTLIGEPMAARS